MSLLVDATWIVAGAGVLGVSAWLYSKTTSPVSGDDDTGDSSLSDSKPRWGSRSRTNWERLAPSAMFSTSCGWSPEEEYCPEAIVAEKSCSTECLRPYLQTSMNLMQNRYNQPSDIYGGSGGATPQLKNPVLCAVTAPVADITNGQAVRARILFPTTIQTGHTTQLKIQTQIMRHMGWTENYAFGKMSSAVQAATVINLKATTADGYGVERTLQPDGSYTGAITLRSVTNSVSKSGWTTWTFDVPNHLLGRGAVNIEATVDYNRLIAFTPSWDWDDMCEFNASVLMTIPSVWFADSDSPCQSGCPAWIKPDSKFYYIACSDSVCSDQSVEIPSWIEVLWTDPAAAAEYPTYQGATASAGTTVLNTETRFPRNGFMVF